MKTKNSCSIDPRVNDTYIYKADRPSTSIAEVMQALYAFRAERNHISSQPGYSRPVYAHEFKGRR